jgi:hypothetical protein
MASLIREFTFNPLAHAVSTLLIKINKPWIKACLKPRFALRLVVAILPYGGVLARPEAWGGERHGLDIIYRQLVLVPACENPPYQIII